MTSEKAQKFMDLGKLKVSLKDPKLNYLHGIIWGLDCPHPDTLEIRSADTDQTEYHALVIDPVLRKEAALKDLITGKSVGVIDRFKTTNPVEAEDFFYKYNNKP